MTARKPPRNSSAPGGHFYYNNWYFNTLGGILEQEVGQSIYEAFYQEIARPLGMQQYTGTYDTVWVGKEDSVFPGFYQFEPSKSRYPAYHFRMSAYDLALYGTLFLNRGRWNGE